MRIYYNDTSLDVQPGDQSYQFREVMGDNLVSLEFSLVDYTDIPIGAYILIDGERYTLYDLPAFTKINERQYDYVLTFHAPQKELERYKFRNMIDGRLKQTITARPEEFLQHIVDNLNARDPEHGWQVGNTIESAEKTASFSHNTIREALDSVAELFGTEWAINGKTIELRKTEYAKGNPLPLAYGRGNGFKSGVSRNLGDEKAIDVLYVQGGNRNIDSQTYTYSKDGDIYHADSLRLPRDRHGWYYPPTDESGLGEFDFNDLPSREDAMEFQTDADGFAVQRRTTVNNGYEESLDLADIYPHYEHTVTRLITDDADKHFYSVEADSPVDYTADNVIAGEQMTMWFQSGMLQGKEFDISKYTHGEGGKGVFEIVPQEVDGIIMPDAPSGYIPTAEDTRFSVLHMRLPEEYVNKAEEEMLLNALSYLYKHSEVDIQFQGTIDGIWAKRNWDDIKTRIGLGYYVMFTDNKFAKDGKRMRILAIKTAINNPHSPELTLGNTTTAQGVSSEIRRIAQNEAYMEKVNADTIAFARRSFRDNKETMTMLQEAFRGGYSEAVSPVTIQTIMALIGDESLQFEFLDKETITTKDGYVTHADVINYTPYFDNGRLIVGQRQILRHRSYTNKDLRTAITSSSATLQFPYWRILSPESGYITLPPDSADKSYYLYVLVSKEALNDERIGRIYEGGTFELRDEPYAERESDTFRLLVGTLNSEYNGERSFAPVFGQTSILGNRLNTDVIRSNDGRMSIDLINGIIQGVFNFVDGLITGQILMGDDSEHPFAGLGGEYALWAGKTNAGVPVFSVFPEGWVTISDNEGRQVLWTAQDGILHLDGKYTSIKEMSADNALISNATVAKLTSSTSKLFDSQGISYMGVYHYRNEYIDSDGDTHYIDVNRCGNIVSISGHISGADVSNNLFFPLNEGYRPHSHAIIHTIHGTDIDSTRSFVIYSSGNTGASTMGSKDWSLIQGAYIADMKRDNIPPETDFHVSHPGIH